MNALPSTSCILRAALVANPRDEHRAALLVDAVAEESDWDPERAREWVRDWLRPHLEEADLAEAARHLAHGSPWRPLLHEWVRKQTRLAPHLRLTVICVKGDGWDVGINPIGDPSRSRYWARVNVMVGAGRVLRIVRLLETRDPVWYAMLNLSPPTNRTKGRQK